MFNQLHNPPHPSFFGVQTVAGTSRIRLGFATHLRPGVRSHHQSLAVVFFANTWVWGTRLYPYWGSSTGSNTWRAPELFAGCWLCFPEAKKKTTLLGGGKFPWNFARVSKKPILSSFSPVLFKHFHINEKSHRNTQSSPSPSQCHAPEPSCA